ncbi:uncharacterized protein LOC114522282 isoform X2 [Dendronephthya gigantea]|uniref:uncharacterized protein LOC114522282 isoform X2 n=1 Tax=Dendronephthya gigantea TaxID=151771 RepID=UPI00106B96B7|nr:uncharacterized protein LOC114522282 isoform X2 [Dendronephthya gigantea]
MAADKLKKLEARGRAAFLHGDVGAATRYFLQALEKQNSPENKKTKPSTPKVKRDKLRSKSLNVLNNNDEDQVWIMQANTQERRNKKNEKEHGKKKKEDKETSVEMLDGIVADANKAIQSFPSYPMGYLRKASALILLNHWEEARQTYTTGLENCSECGLLKSALYNLNKTHKITSCAANLDTKQLSDLLNDNSPSQTLTPPNPAAMRRHKFRLQGQRRLTKKIFPRESEALSIPQIQATSFRRRNSSSTDTHL